MSSPRQESDSLDVQVLVDSIPALIHSARPDGYLDYFNKRWLEYFGVTLDKVLGWNWTAVIHPEDVDGIVAKWRASLESGEVFEYETRVRRADGEYRWMFHRKVPLRDANGNIVKWYGSSLDIEERKQAEEGLRVAMSERTRLAAVRGEVGMALARKDDLRGILRACAEAMVRHLGAAFARIWTFNSEAQELELQASAGRYTRLDGRYSRIPLREIKVGRIAEERKPHLTNDVQNDPRISDKDWARAEKMVAFAGYPLIVEDRIVGVMAMFSTKPQTENENTLETLSFIADGIAQGIERKRAEEAIRRSEAYLAEAQRLSHTGSFGWKVSTGDISWSDETFRIFEYDRSVKTTIDSVVQRVHPQDRADFQKVIDGASREATEFEHAYRLLLPDGRVKHVHAIAHAVQNTPGGREFIGAVTDITERKTTEDKIRRLVEADILGIFIAKVEGEIVEANQAFLRMLRYGRQDLVSGQLRWMDLTPAELLERDQRALTEALATGVFQPYEKEYFRKDGSRVPVLTGGALFQSANEGVVFVLDLSEQKRAEQKIREQEAELRQIVDLVPQVVAVFGPGGERLYANRILLNYLGATLEEWRQISDRDEFVHPDDRERAIPDLNAVPSGASFELELRLRKHDGSYRWFLARYNPVRDDKGQVARWYVAGTDIEDRKQAEDRLRSENVALREEIASASMFEDIVGTSPALKAVLSRVSKVAPSDSTVLITGETGTGKELVARAIHRRSDRASRAFVSVNCAAIPRDLVASELFGHEKGAFTGATQQRLGRFELARGGTIFLDEVGELPAETQIALLRVLQEHEFERVGGTRSISADVRVIAATHRDLQAAISAGSFRSDLFYRLNVFPIEIPSLRQRRDDIPLLVEYFIEHYARKARKNIKRVGKKTLALLQSYPWPGNIRELQNVVERSVILCETEIFSIDESWLPQHPLLTAEPKPQVELPRRLLVQEKDMIEAALKESCGRVSGPAGAAVKLGIPRSTLESKIKSLKIDRNRFRTLPEI